MDVPALGSTRYFFKNKEYKHVKKMKISVIWKRGGRERGSSRTYIPHPNKNFHFPFYSTSEWSVILSMLENSSYYIFFFPTSH